MDEEIKRIFGINLTNLINTSGRTQKEVADALGFNTSTLNMWCKGNSFPSQEKLSALAEYFEVSPTYFTTDHNMKPIKADISYSWARNYKNLIFEAQDMSSDNLSHLVAYAQFLNKNRKED